MAYVPPALRRKQEAAAKNDDAGNGRAKSPTSHHPLPLDKPLPHVNDIQNHFWPRTAENLEHGGVEGDFQSMASQSHSTLNGCAESPDKLKYILLFKDANPRWDRDGIIFAKTNLHLLPKQDNDGKRMIAQQANIHEELRPQEPSIATQIDVESNQEAKSTQNNLILVFRQFKSRGSGFEFVGHFHISRVHFLEPNSEELVRMLEQKFTVTNKAGKSRQYQRDPTAWKESLSHQWAVLKMEKDEQADKTLHAPVIEIKKGEQLKHKSGHKENKSVNELLREMRLGQHPVSQTEAA